jgi:hypothetical protein
MHIPWHSAHRDNPLVAASQPCRPARATLTIHKLFSTFTMRLERKKAFKKLRHCGLDPQSRINPSIMFPHWIYSGLRLKAAMTCAVTLRSEWVLAFHDKSNDGIMETLI